MSEPNPSAMDVVGAIDINSASPMTLTNTTLSADVNSGIDPTSASTGSITLTTPALSITGGGITAQSTGTRKAGDLILNVDQLTTQSGSTPLPEGDADATTRVQINSSGTSAGDAGRILIRGQGGEGSSIPNPVSFANTDISTEAQESGTAGLIDIAAPTSVALTNTQVSATASGSGDAGSITFAETGSFASTNSQITTEANTGAGGSITIPVTSPVTLTDTEISATGTGNAPVEKAGGSIALSATALTINDGTIEAETAGQGPGGSIDITAPVSVALNGTHISATANGSGDAGSITFAETGSFSARGGRIETVANTGAGGTITIPSTSTMSFRDIALSATSLNNTVEKSGGSIALTATDLSVGGGGIQAETAGQGPGGSVTITAPTSVTLNNTRVSATASGSGDAGSITFAETGNFSSTNSQITTEANTGAGGSITIPVTSPVTLTDTEISATGTGNAPVEKAGGSIALSATALTINDGTIEAETAGQGPGGSVTITAPTSVALTNTQVSATASGSGDAGSITFAETGSFSATGSRIETVANTGAGGTITIPSTSTMSFSNTPLSATSQNNTVEKSGGSIALTATDLSVSGGGIQAETAGAGPGGSIDIIAPTNVVLTNTTVSATARGSGNAGNITFAETGNFSSTNSQITTQANTGAGGNISFAGLENTLLDSTTISATVNPDSPQEGGQGGNITIIGGQSNPSNPNFGNEQLLVRNQSSITAQSFGQGDAGTINLQTAGTLRLSDSTIQTTASEASGGRIKLDAGFMVHILNSQLISSVQGSAQDTNGGDINIDPEFVIVQNSQILAQAEAGTGGNIDLIGNVVLIDSFSTLNADSRLGVSGNVNISSPIQNLSGAIAPLPETIIQTATLYGARCAAQKGSEFSSFNVRGRDRVPFEPGDYLLTPLGQEDNVGQNLLKRLFPSSPLLASRDNVNSLRPQGLDLVVSFERKSTFFIFDGKCSS